MSSDDIAIRIQGVSKHYLIYQRPEDRLKQMLLPRLERLAGRPPRRYYRDFAALNDVSFEVKRGETVGIIGRNGSGKSTLLQIICGTLQPTSGTLDVNGRVAALLELGSGFNPEFTGRENVYLNGAVLGLSRADIDSRFDAIARFADIGMFIDQPVKTYSSGMYVRLAFAVAINVDPDILVVDEALSVGDEAFQRKCFARIEAIKDNGGTILFVSHGAQTIVQLCDRAMLIDRGEKILEGKPKIVVSQYQRFMNLAGAEAEPVRQAIKAMNGYDDGPPAAGTPAAEAPKAGQPEATKAEEPDLQDDSWFDPTLISHSRIEYESKGSRIRDVRILTLDNRPVNVLRSGHRYVYEYCVDFDRDIDNVGFGIMIKIVDGFGLGGAATDFERSLRLPRVAAGSSYRVRFNLLWRLAPGTYFMNAGVTGHQDGNHFYAHRLLDAIAFRMAPSERKLVTGYVDLDPQPHIECIGQMHETQIDRAPMQQNTNNH